VIGNPLSRFARDPAYVVDPSVPDLLTSALLVLASALAGFIDAIAGGGGLILMPALLMGLPGSTPIPTVLGTNKLAACTGTSVAAWQFARAKVVPGRELILPLLAAVIGAGFGVQLAYHLDRSVMRPVMLTLLVAMLLWSLLQPNLGDTHAPRLGRRTKRLAVGGISLALGFYDGFFGPGTGSLLIFLFVAVLGYDFVRASALAKSANWGSNASALVLFVAHGSWLPGLAVLLAVGNVIGARLGARLAITRGNRFIRHLFIAVVGALVARLAWQLWQG
jgi:uncharacterized protein